MAFIKLNRDIAFNDVFLDNDMLALYVKLILSARTAPGIEKGMDVARGQLVVSVRKLAERFGFTYQRTRTLLKKLEETQLIEMTADSACTLITVLNFDCDNDFSGTATQQATQEKRREQRGNNAASLLGKENKSFIMQEPRACAEKTDNAAIREQLVDQFGEVNVAEYERRFEIWKSRQVRSVGVSCYDVIGRWMTADNVVKPRENSLSFNIDGIMQSVISGYGGGSP